MKKSLLPLLFLLPSVILFTSCSDDDNSSPTPDPDPIVDINDIVGEWLCSTASADVWTTYEFKATARFNISLYNNGTTTSGNGYFYLESDNVFTASYEANSNTHYLDWVFIKATAMQIDYKLYNNNTYLGEESLYRILATYDLEAEASTAPEYRTLTGSNKNSDFYSLDPTVATVDASSGKITAVQKGSTFVIFTTSAGQVAVRVNVTSDPKTFAEQILGTWVNDIPAENIWETYKFSSNGYVYVEWWLDYGSYSSYQSGDGTYSISNDNIVTFSISSSSGILNQEYRTTLITAFDWTYKAYSGNTFVGIYTVHKLLDTVNLNNGETVTPDYASLTEGYAITGYSVHDKSVATVDATTGKITAVGYGRTYVDVATSAGTGVVEINIDSPIPVAFQDCIGQTVSKVYSVIGSNPTSTSDKYIIYSNYSTTIDQVAVQLDSWSNLVRGIVVTYNSKVDKNAVTSVLNNTFIAYASGTTSTLLAYMDTDERSTANVGVTWDLSSLTLTYVNLFDDYFKDYTVLLGLTRAEAIAKVGSDPLINNDQSMSWFLNQDLVGMTSAYYTDFTKYYTTACYVASILMSSADNDKVVTYLKRKYSYYAEYSSDDELTFVSKDGAYAVYFEPADKLIMYMMFDLSGYEQVTSQSMGRMVSKARLLKKKVLANKNAR
ncbi:MAG: hypothetical protein LUC85_03915 [Bacteroidales bacterium]|nr:hypothetical protein [Bacteroidales bacterium]MCD8393966.1 hypothetical protein [Bacteroidales bacterium]